MCTLEIRGNIFFLTLKGANEHRLSPTLILEIRSLLQQIQSESKPGSVLVTTGQGRFFSNGLDLAYAESNGPSEFRQRLRQMVTEFKLLIGDLFSLPLPTIAAVNGHAAAAGFMLAIGHDYVLMRKDRGVIYMSELDIGMSYPDNFMDLMRAKLGPSKNLRNVVLQGMKIKGEEAVKLGIIDSAYDSGEATVEAAMRLGEKLGLKKWSGEVYSEIRKSSFKDMLPVFGLVEKEVLVAKL